MLTPRSNAPMSAASPLDTSPRESGANERPEVEDRLVNQRRALEEMSQQLLDKLNVTVTEQEARALEFAQRVHSVSSLSRQEEGQPAAPAPESVKATVARQKERAVPQPKYRDPIASKLREKTTSLSKSTRAWLEDGMEMPSEKSDNRGCLFFAAVIFIIYIIFQFL